MQGQRTRSIYQRKPVTFVVGLKERVDKRRCAGRSENQQSS